MDQDTKKKLITIAIAFLIFAITYFVVKSKYIKPRLTGYKRTVILHKDGQVKDKITYDEYYSNFQMGFFILTVTFIVLLTSSYLFCFKGNSSYSADIPSPSIDINPIQPLE